MSLPVNIASNTLQDGSNLAGTDHPTGHNELNNSHNTFWGGDYSLRKLTIYGAASAARQNGLPASTRVEIIEGSAASPVTAQGYSMLVQRRSQIVGSPTYDAAIVGGIYSNGDTYQAAGAGIAGGGVSYGWADVVGVSGQAYIDAAAGAHGQSAIGGYFMIADQTGVNYGNALNPVILAYGSHSYPGIGTPGYGGIMVQADTGTGDGSAWVAGVGVQVYANDPVEAIFDGGFVVSRTSALTFAYRDDSDATTSVDINGAHTNGIDLSGATFSGQQIILKGWTTYTPTITSGTGTLTSVAATGRYLLLGKLLFFAIHITITTNGTGATDIRVPLPASLTSAGVTLQMAHGQEIATTADALIGRIGTTATFMNVQFYDGSYPGADGYQLVLSGVVEVA